MSCAEAVPDSWREEREELLNKRIRDLGLKLEGTRLEKIVTRLYDELEKAGISLRPPVYLSNEWGCPDGIPVIAMPFYLSDPKLCRLEEEMMEEVEAETDDEILAYLRHEAGHAINYAHKLYEAKEWTDTFGPFYLPYNDDYSPNPFSHNYVRHISGWYAQKHPDEDFAETFAVWLDPNSNWRELYRDWGCYHKLLYVDRIIKERGRERALVGPEAYDINQEDLSFSVAEHYRRFSGPVVQIPSYFDGVLMDIFTRAPQVPDDGFQPADRFITANRRTLVSNISYWTGVDTRHIRSLLEHLAQRAKHLNLWVQTRNAPQVLVELSTLATTLSMNKLYKGDFVIK